MIDSPDDYPNERMVLEDTPLEDNQRTLVERIRTHAMPQQNLPTDFNMLLRLTGEARFVLLGEASHGTHEFYQARVEISKRLIEEHGFLAIAVEADWPDAYRVNRYIQQRSNDSTAAEALGDFKRFPTWMWRNTDVLAFVDWLHDYNAALPENQRKVAFYGLDLYSLHASVEAVISYLDQVDPEAARRARYRYGCFDQFGEDPHAYGYAASFDLTQKCEAEVVQQLRELRKQAHDYLHQDGFVAQDEFFYAEQNARIAINAERYYRAMFDQKASSWNLRDRHMAETLEGLANHYDRIAEQEPPAHSAFPAKFIVWAHNSHLGDARATEVTRSGEINVGQLVRERFGKQVFSVGFTTHHGTVTAASDWGGPAERKHVRPALPGSFERLFHATGLPGFTLLLSGMDEELLDLNRDRLERAIGVIYRPESERLSHYFYARLMDQFNVVIHCDQTRAVEPIDRNSEWETGEVPETYPTGM